MLVTLGIKACLAVFLTNNILYSYIACPPMGTGEFCALEKRNETTFL